jgi:hypothetical protein
VAVNTEVDAGRPELKIAQHNFVEKRWQARIAQSDFAAPRVEFEPSDASRSVNGVALAQACGAQATG